MSELAPARSATRRAAPLAVVLASSLLGGCAHPAPSPWPTPRRPAASVQPQPHVVGEPGLVPPRRIEGSCAAEPPNPKEAQETHLSGFARLSYVVRADGTVDSIEPEILAPALFAEAGRAWLASCRFEAGTLDGKPVDVQSQKVLAFRNPPPLPPLPGEEQPPLDERKAPAGTTPPRPVACAPLEVPWGGRYPAEIDFIVHRDGRVSDVSVREGPVAIPPPSLELLLAWLDTCPFEPGRAEGKPVALRSRIVNRFPPDYPLDEGVLAVRGRSANVALLSAGMAPPEPRDCQKPAMPEEARQGGISGVVIAGYVVGLDGKVSWVSLYNPGVPWILFKAVRDSLLACRFSPAKAPDGRAVPVKMIQPFNFKFSS